MGNQFTSLDEIRETIRRHFWVLFPWKQIANVMYNNRRALAQGIKGEATPFYKQQSRRHWNCLPRKRVPKEAFLSHGIERNNLNFQGEIFNMVSENTQLRNQVNVRLTDSEHAKLRELSSRMGKSQSEVMRLNFKKRVELLNQRRIDMSDNDRREILAVMNKMTNELQEIKRDGKKFGNNYNNVGRRFSMEKYAMPTSKAIEISETIESGKEYKDQLMTEVAKLESEMAKIWQLLK